MPSTIKQTLKRWTLRTLAGLAATIVVVIGSVYALSEYRLQKRVEVPSHPIVVRTDSTTVARGAHIAQSRGCLGCHGQNLVGRVELDNFLLGRLAGPNLTLGGRGKDLTDADWERAVRHGVRRDGSGLFIMPAFEHTGMSDEDLAAIVAYARSLPPSPNTLPKSRAGPVIRAMFIAGVVPVLSAEMIEHKRPHPDRVIAEPTAQYGAYLAPTCQGCHGPNLAGGKIPGGPPDWKPAANLTPAGIGHYTEGDFIRALRTGQRPDGSKIDPQMPWELYKTMTDTELRALYAYLHSLEPRIYGTR
jgi:mono/diheme cytochrome c family protein